MGVWEMKKGGKRKRGGVRFESPQIAKKEKKNKKLAPEKKTFQMLQGDSTHQKIVVGASVKLGRASPKSQIFSLQSELARMFFGFRSRWKTLAECTYLSPRNSW